LAGERGQNPDEASAIEPTPTHAMTLRMNLSCDLCPFADLGEDFSSVPVHLGHPRPRRNDWRPGSNHSIQSVRGFDLPWAQAITRVFGLIICETEF
jgi:hypothetical protein